MGFLAPLMFGRAASGGCSARNDAYLFGEMHRYNFIFRTTNLY